MNVNSKINLFLILLTGFVLSCKTFGVKKPQGPVDFQELLQMAEMAGAIYEPNEDIRKKYEKFEVIIHTLPGQGKYLLITDNEEKRHYLVIRGTNNVSNTILDLKYLKTKDDKTGLYLHRGFLEMARDLYENITQFIKKDYTLYITGHSLGGAVAVIIMMYLKKDGIRVEKVYTFGQPKVTNGQGAEEFADAPLIRVINKSDVVSMIPFTSLVSIIFGSYEHFGKQLILLDNEKYIFVPESKSEKYKLGDFWKNLFKKRLSTKSIQYHSIAEYIQNIRGKQEKSLLVEPGHDNQTLEEMISFHKFP